eukprot:4728725-Prymnesium_polylepis.2
MEDASLSESAVPWPSASTSPAYSAPSVGYVPSPISVALSSAAIESSTFLRCTVPLIVSGSVPAGRSKACFSSTVEYCGCREFAAVRPARSDFRTASSVDSTPFRSSRSAMHLHHTDDTKVGGPSKFGAALMAATSGRDNRSAPSAR